MSAHATDKDPKLTRRQAENARAAIDVGKMLRLLKDNAEGLLKDELSPARIKGIQILLDKSLPTLQSIDSHVTTDKPEMTPEQVDEELDSAIVDIIRHDPERITRLQVQAKQPWLKVV